MVGIVAVAPAVAGRAGARASAPVTFASRPESGAVMIGWHEAGDDVDLLHTHETELGTRFALVRMYQQWQLPSRRVAAMINEGRLVLVSHKPPTTGAWAAVASGAEDAMIQKLAEAYKAFDREVLFTFHHEPHDDASDVKGGTYGTTADYLAAWRRIRSIFDRVGASHSAGGHVFFAYSATGSWALKAAPGGAPGSGDPLYPGDDVIDVFAHDRYNWASCRNDAWEEFSSEWAPLVKLAAAHRKPLLAAEFGSPPAGGARNDWFRNAAAWLKTDPLARQWFWGFAYFHTLHDSCPWDFLSQADDGRLGWQDAFRDPYFTGTPFSLATRSKTGVLEGAGTAPPSVGVAPPPKPGASPAPTSTTRPPTASTGPPTTPSSPAGAPNPGATGAGGPGAGVSGTGGAIGADGTGGAGAGGASSAKPADPTNAEALGSLASATTAGMLAAGRPSPEAAASHEGSAAPRGRPAPSSANSPVLLGLAGVLSSLVVARRLLHA